MTRDEAEQFIEEWRPRLAPEWEVKVKEGFDPQHAASEVFASIDRQGDGRYLRATLYLGDTIDPNADLSELDRKRFLLHELLHMTLGDLKRAALEPTNRLAPGERDVAVEFIDWQVERAVDRLAVMLGEFT